MIKKLYLFLCLLDISNIYSQPLSGVWKGYTEHSILMLNPSEVVLEISFYNDSLITGVIHNYYKRQKFDHTKISGVFNEKDSVITLTEDKEITHNINSKFYETCLGKMVLTLSKKGNTYVMSGKWKDQSKKNFHCPALKITFKKNIEEDYAKGNKMQFPDRATEIQKVIELNKNEADSIKCSLYDNGEIDNDSVTVFFNDSVIIKNQRISDKPIEFIISLDKTKTINKIKLLALNLGLIPPNTALLIITTSKNRYSLTLSSDFSLNGSVEFFLKE
jgi:hypothetical protein